MGPNDRTVVDAHNKSTMASIVGWLALILSVIALILAWMAYDNASDENLSEKIQDGLRGTTQVEERQPDDVDDTMLNSDPATNDTTTTPEEGDTTDTAPLPEENQNQN